VGGVFFRLSPEDGVGVFVEVVEEVLDAGAGVQRLVTVVVEVAVAPVQRPETGGLDVVQAGDGEPGPLRAQVVAPGRSALADRQMAGGDIALDADLAAQPLGDLGGAPPLHASDVELGKSAAGHGRHDRHPGSAVATRAATGPAGPATATQRAWPSRAPGGGGG